MKKKIKKHYKIVVGIIIGIALSTVITKAEETVLSGSDVIYNSESSDASNVQKAIDDLYEKSNSCSSDNSNKNIVKAYEYSESTCPTGSESECKETECYKNKEAGSCKAGDMITYKVNDSTTRTFHVMYDDGGTMTLLDSENIVDAVAWYSSSSVNNYGPTTALTALESATAGWTNVNDLTYSIGNSNSTLGYSGCPSYNLCQTNTYTIETKTEKARLITVQEAGNLGCTGYMPSCPKWMYKNLKDTGGTANGYWTMNADGYNNFPAYEVFYRGNVSSTYVTSTDYGVRAVVKVNK